MINPWKQHENEHILYDSYLNIPERAEPDIITLAQEIKGHKTDAAYILQLIEDRPAVYALADPSIRTFEFKQQALIQNPDVYEYLSHEDRQHPEINRYYLNSMCARMQPVLLPNAQGYVMQFASKFSENTPWDKVLTEKVYETAYTQMVTRTPYAFDNVINEYAMVCELAKQKNPEIAERYLEIEERVWQNHQDRLQELAKENTREAQQALEIAIERVPEYAPMITQMQIEKNREEKERRIEMAHKEQNVKQEVSHSDKENEFKLHLEQAQKENISALKESVIAEAYGRANSGDIDFEMAHDIASYVGNIPSIADHGQAVSMRAQMIAKGDDVQNIDVSQEMVEQDVLEELEQFERKYANIAVEYDYGDYEQDIEYDEHDVDFDLDLSDR